MRKRAGERPAIKIFTTEDTEEHWGNESLTLEAQKWSPAVNATKSEANPASQLTVFAWFRSTQRTPGQTWSGTCECFRW